MYLKQLELKGFKSFAEQTEFEFVPGITAVVGPNGSGKSNVSDAVRWVLGEQSARTLRGGKMEDIIFSGSESRHAVNYCDVTLTLDNSEGKLPLSYHEVTVTRRLYRSGDSEYYINRQLCRLKDITELFMDTGLGKESYSIIGQGRIDEILSTKAEERRGVFEDAAGIVKFKVRKREAERKLEETEQNLARLHDIIYELQEQAGPLAEQAETAKMFRRLRDQLKQWEIGLYVHKITTVHRRWEKSSEERNISEREKTAAETALKQHEATMEKQKWQLRKLDERLENAQQKLLTTSEALEKAEGQRDVLIERASNRQREKERFQKQAENLQIRLAHTERDLTQVKEALEDKQSEVAHTREELEKRENHLRQLAADADEQLEDVKAELIELLGEQASLKNDLRHLDDEENKHHERRRKMQKEREQAKADQAHIERELRQMAQAKAALAKQLQNCRRNYESTKRKRERILALEQKQAEAMREIEQKLHRLTSRCDVLTELEADYSGFFHGVKEVLKAREQGVLRGIEGAVAELISVPRDLETALETALGGALQHVIVHNESHGRQAIHYLKHHRLGRATFLPMDTIQPRTFPSRDREQLSKDEGFVGIGVDLVNFDRSYNNVFASLLGHIVVAKKLVDANRIARLLRYRYRVVTMDGDIVHPGGSMSGGSAQKQKANLLGRKRELDELRRHIETVQMDKKKLAKAMRAQWQEKEMLENELESMRLQGEELRLQVQKLSSQLDYKRSEQQQINERQQNLQRDWERLLEETEDRCHRRKEIKAAIAEKEQAEQQLNDELTRLEQKIKVQKQQEEKENSTITELKVNLAKYRQDLEHLLENRNRLEKERESLQSEQQLLAQQMIELGKRLEDNEQEKEDCAHIIHGLRAERDAVRARLEDIRKHRSEQQEALNEIDAVHRQRRQALQAIEKTLHHQEVQVNRLDVELNSLLTSLSEQYEISFELAKERYETPQDPEEAETKVKELQQQITALGEVNLGAIEESERIEERLKFLEKQQQDLLEAKATLYKVIQEMDMEMSQRFETTFRAIRKQFQNVFVELFDGGRADLQLTDPDSLLDTGIEIVAQPPGKKLQHLSLLSGGEKTLTAIVLLFAILRVRPVPFCILDEVDAALDETNVVRFARYLRTFSEDTQFIVITHRKGTMEEADVLYGVTMQESGVSHLVSVKLEEGAAQEIAASSEER